MKDISVGSGVPDPATVRMSLASHALETGHFAVAAELMERSLADDYDSLEVRVALVASYIGLGRLRLAEQAVEEAMERYGNDDALKRNAATVYSLLGNSDAAATLLESLVTDYANDTNLRAQLGWAYYWSGRPFDSAKEFLRILRRGVFTSGVSLGLGLASMELGSMNRARGCLARCLNADEELAGAHFSLGLLAIDEERYDIAASHFARYGQEAREDELARFYLSFLRQWREPSSTVAVGSFPPGSKHVRECWEATSQFIYDNRHAELRITGTRVRGLIWAMELASSVSGLVMEFGVWNGASINILASQTDSTVHGFDTLEGLPTAWGSVGQGAYTANGQVPRVRHNVDIHPGLFADTVKRFMSEYNAPVSMAHIDCDLYSSTRDVLESIESYLVTGSVLVFDEFLMNETWKDDEYRAFVECVSRCGLSFKYLLLSPFTKQAIVRIT